MAEISAIKVTSNGKYTSNFNFDVTTDKNNITLAYTGLPKYKNKMFSVKLLRKNDNKELNATFYTDISIQIGQRVDGDNSIIAQLNNPAQLISVKKSDTDEYLYNSTGVVKNIMPLQGPDGIYYINSSNVGIGIQFNISNINNLVDTLNGSQLTIAISFYESDCELFYTKLTKKLKIKQQDGTFGADIPYGTEAKYVDTIDADGNKITLEENLQQLKAYIDNEINKIIEGSY